MSTNNNSNSNTNNNNSNNNNSNRNNNSNNSNNSNNNNNKFNNNNNRKKNNFNRKNNNNYSSGGSKVKGKCEDLKGHVFDCTSRTQTDQFVTTCREIAEYVGRTYKYGGDIKITLEKLEAYVIPRPERPVDIDDEIEKLIFTKEVDEYVKRKAFLRENMKTAYSLIWGQCSDFLKQKLKSTDDYETFNGEQDPVGLLKAIKTINFKFEDHRYFHHSIYEAHRNFYVFRQAQGQSNSEYLEQFKNQIDLLEQHGESFKDNSIYLDHDQRWKKLSARNQTDEKKQEAKERCKEQYVAYAFIYKSDNDRYNKLKEELQNDYMKGNNNYPDTLVEAYQMLTNYRQPNNKKLGTKSSGVSFAQQGKNKNSKGNNSRNSNNNNKFADYECYKCHKKGHIASNCPDNKGTTNTNVQSNADSTTESEKNHEGTQNFNLGVISDRGNYSFIEHATVSNIDSKIMRDWNLLDNQSTTDIFCNSRLLENIHDTNEKMTLHSNGGTLITTQKGILDGYGEVWYHPDAITNILSMSNVKQKYRVTYDSHGEDRFIVYRPNELLYFNCSANGLYFHDTMNKHVTLVSPISDNLEGFSQRQIENAKKAKKLYNIMGLPSVNDYKQLVKNNMLYNNPVTVEDINNSEKRFGKS